MDHLETTGNTAYLFAYQEFNNWIHVWMEWSYNHDNSGLEPLSFEGNEKYVN